MVLIFFQLGLTVLAGLSVFFVWDADRDASALFALWFVALGVFAFGQFLAFGQCRYWARYLLLVSALLWLAVLLWAAIVYAWYSVFSSVVVFLLIFYWVVLAWEFSSTYGAGVVPRIKSVTSVVAKSASAATPPSQGATRFVMQYVSPDSAASKSLARPPQQPPVVQSNGNGVFSV